MKIRVDSRIRKEWDGKDIYQRSLKTSDPAQAKREVRAIRAIMDAQIDKAKAAEGIEALKRNLTKDQRALLDRSGGVDGLLASFERGKIALAFRQAGVPADAGDIDVETYANGAPYKLEVGGLSSAEELAIAKAEHCAGSNELRAQVNAEGRALRQLGQNVALIGDVFSLRDLVEEWAPAVDPQTADSARYFVRRFTEMHGEIAVKDLTAAHLRDFLKAVKGLPKITSGKLDDGRFVRDLSLDEAVKWAKSNRRETLGDATLAKYHSMLRRLLAFAVEQGYRSDDPWKNVKLAKVKQKFSAQRIDARRPFTAAEVRQLLDYVSQSDDPKYGRETVDYWGPWIAAHHGMRLQEVAQIRLCDFEMRDGVFSMQITDEGENQRAKSRATVRWVPVHPRLLEIGLREHIERRRSIVSDWQAGAFVEWARYAKGYVELTPDARGRVSSNYGKRFNRLREETLKITGENVSFHSFRHRLQDAADNVGIPDSHRRYLTGRANPDVVEGGYGNGAAMRYLFDSLAKVDPMAD
ncbi:hypothetical protein [Thioclava sp. GXIMD4215]|uniref:site-specific integrase n=1 Tax=Thioclava sp. GXIMD4215 TaxID=3131928 RepID=UPI00324563FC